jgi:hypothetical protein
VRILAIISAGAPLCRFTAGVDRERVDAGFPSRKCCSSRWLGETQVL